MRLESSRGFGRAHGPGRRIGVGDGPTDGLVIHGCRFRDLFADGVNLCNGASRSIVGRSNSSVAYSNASSMPVADSVATSNRSIFAV